MRKDQTMTKTSKWIRTSLWVGIILAGLFFLAWRTMAAQPGRPEKIPAVVQQSIARTLPGARISSVESKPQVMLIYEVELVINGQPHKAEVFANGEVLNVRKVIPAGQLPQAVSQALNKEAKGAPVTQTAEKQVHATVAISRRRQPLTVYQAQYELGGRNVQVEFDASGKLLSRKMAGDDDDDDDDENEEDIDLKDCPEPVQRTIRRHAGEHRIHEVEKQTRNGRTTYEAEWRENGQEVEITVDSQGKLLEKEVGDDDDEDDEDDDDDDDDDD
jgi:uncharacterized membrane protein YkoI